MRLHVLTAITRPENLPEIAASIAEAAQKRTDWEIVWHWRFDPELRHVGGQALKNEMLDGFEDGWVFILDDDTTMHPDLLEVVASIIDSYEVPAIVVSQRGSNLKAARKNVKVGGIDSGQAVIRRSVIGERRIPHEYAGDGVFLEFLRYLEDVAYDPRELSHYNALRGWSNQ